MSQLLKVEEWDSAGVWHVADIKTFTGWRAMARVFGIDQIDQFIELLRDKYHAERIEYLPTTSAGNDLLLFSFEKYKDAHQLKLDVNRIARKQNIQVEKWARY